MYENQNENENNSVQMKCESWHSIFCVCGTFSYIFFLIGLICLQSGCNPNVPGGCPQYSIATAYVTNFTKLNCISNTNACVGFLINFDRENAPPCTYTYNDIHGRYKNIEYYINRYTIGTKIKVNNVYEVNTECSLISVADYNSWLAGVIFMSLMGITILCFSPFIVVSFCRSRTSSTNQPNTNIQ